MALQTASAQKPDPTHADEAYGMPNDGALDDGPMTPNTYTDQRGDGPKDPPLAVDQMKFLMNPDTL
jgi:hypothetical protein